MLNSNLDLYNSDSSPKISGRLLQILNYKIKELESEEEKLGLAEMEKIVDNINSSSRDFVKDLSGKSEISLIAEIKKASPSLGDINLNVNVVDLAKKYEEYGAQAISVLTEKNFFKGDLAYLQAIKPAVSLPLLRKDFLFTPYQIYQSKLYGADAVLLMATILTEQALVELVDLAHDLSMSCLVETHSRSDVDKALKTKARVIGINARDLQTLQVDLQTIIDLAPQIPKTKILVAESGIKTSKDVLQIKQAGIRAILVGTSLMQSYNLAQIFKELKQYD